MPPHKSGSKCRHCSICLRILWRHLGLLGFLSTTTHAFNDPFPGLPRWAITRKVKPIWILLMEETVSGSGVSWGICKSAPRSRQITTPAPHHSVFYRTDALPVVQPTVSKLWRHTWQKSEYVSACRKPSGQNCLWCRKWLQLLAFFAATLSLVLV